MFLWGTIAFAIFPEVMVKKISDSRYYITSDLYAIVAFFVKRK